MDDIRPDITATGERNETIAAVLRPRTGGFPQGGGTVTPLWTPSPSIPPLPFRIEGGRAIIPLHRDWDETGVVHWVTKLLQRPGLVYPEDDSPPFLRGAGHWQLDSGNDWWAEVRIVPPTEDAKPARTELIITARYGHQPLVELATWIAARLEPRD